MAIIKCKECGYQVSDQAVSCPNCGAPISISKNNAIRDRDYMLAIMILVLGPILILSGLVIDSVVLSFIGLLIAVSIILFWASVL